MTSKQILFDFNKAYGSKARDKAIKLLQENLSILLEKEIAKDLVFTAATFGDIELLDILYSNNCDINIANSASHPETPLACASYQNNTESVKWLVEHGATINTPWPNEIHQWCHGLSSAIRSNNIEIVRLLVEAGAALDVCDRTNRTPLQWAIDYRRSEIANYLLSKGAVEPQLGKSYKTPEVKSPLVQSIEHRFCVTHPLMWQPIIPEGTTVPIRSIEDLRCCGLFTDGMSSRKLTFPKGKRGAPHVELFLPIGVGPTMEEVKANQFPWAIDWMQKLARYPFQDGNRFEKPVTIVSNDDPPKPLGRGTKMTCWLLLARKEPLAEIQLSDAETVVFFSMLPIHTKERDFEREHGSRALLEKFAAKKVPEHFVLSRKCVV